MQRPGRISPSPFRCDGANPRSLLSEDRIKRRCSAGLGRGDGNGVRSTNQEPGGCLHPSRHTVLVNLKSPQVMKDLTAVL